MVPVSLRSRRFHFGNLGVKNTDTRTVGAQTAPRTITFLGTVADVLVPSPFGEVAGRTAAVSAEFDNVGNDVHFTFVGGFVAGSHSTWNFTATGSLYLPPEE